MGKYRKLAEDIMNNVGGNWYYNRDPFIQTKRFRYKLVDTFCFRIRSHISKTNS